MTALWTSGRFGMFTRLGALVRKECLQVVRDPSAILIAFVLPVILLFLFAYAVSLDIRKLAIGVVLESDSASAQSLAAAFGATRYFKVTASRDRREVADGVTAGELRGFVVNDLKAREFTPEAAGKMNLYLSAVDDRFRQAGDQPSIGLILCRSKNRVIAEYALRDMTKPIGVSGYVTKLVDSLPKALKGAVPSVADLEKGLTAKTP